MGTHRLTRVLLPSMSRRLQTLCTESPSPHTPWTSRSTSSTNPTTAPWTDGSFSSEAWRGARWSQGLTRFGQLLDAIAAPWIDKQRLRGEPGRGARCRHRKAPSPPCHGLLGQSHARRHPPRLGRTRGAWRSWPSPPHPACPVRGLPRCWAAPAFQEGWAAVWPEQKAPGSVGVRHIGGWPGLFRVDHFYMK